MNISELLTNPRGFFEELKEQKPSNGRYIWLIFLAGVISAIGLYLSQMAMNDALAGVPGMPSLVSGPGFRIISAFFGGIFASVVGWLLMWGLGTIGTGATGRGAEVYGASFIIPLIISMIVIPLYLLMPVQFSILPPEFSKIDPEELGQAIQKYQIQLQKENLKSPMTIITNVLNFLTLAWQFFVAWIGFNVITGDRSKALKGVLFPAVFLLILGMGGWLISQMALGLGG